MVPQASLNFTTSLQSVRMPNNSEKKFYKDHVYESVTQSDTLFLSPFSFFLQFPEALMYCCFFFFVCLIDFLSILLFIDHMLLFMQLELFKMNSSLQNAVKDMYMQCCFG